MDSVGTFPPTNVYVASSWRNQEHGNVVKALTNNGYKVYDFKDKGFGFSDVPLPFSHQHESLESNEFLDLLAHEMCEQGFERDMNALLNSDIVVLVLPCERDAHLELGWAVGAGKQTHILLDNPTKASLMYRMVDFIHPTLEDLLVTLGEADG